MNEPQLVASALATQKLIDREIARGVDSKRLLFVGFSQGGAVVYQAALTYPRPRGGLLVMSSYFATANGIEPDEANRQITILIRHGLYYVMVSEILGQKTYSQLQPKGYEVSYETYPVDHSVCAEQINAISK